MYTVKVVVIFFSWLFIFDVSNWSLY